MVGVCLVLAPNLNLLLSLRKQGFTCFIVMCIKTTIHYEE